MLQLDAHLFLCPFCHFFMIFSSLLHVLFQICQPIFTDSFEERNQSSAVLSRISFKVVAYKSNQINKLDRQKEWVEKTCVEEVVNIFLYAAGLNRFTSDERFVALRQRAVSYVLEAVRRWPQCIFDLFI